MRLIDADKLIDNLDEMILADDGGDYAMGIATAIQEVGRMAFYEEVKAITIEWIKKKKVDFQNKDYPFNYCRGMQDGFNDCIDYLLSEWEKESRKGEEEK